MKREAKKNTGTIPKIDITGQDLEEERGSFRDCEDALLEEEYPQEVRDEVRKIRKEELEELERVRRSKLN
jgi:hypothetical protein